jgi:hypothetical protein
MTTKERRDGAVQKNREQRPFTKLVENDVLDIRSVDESEA